jgi:hypothetical protein
LIPLTQHSDGIVGGIAAVVVVVEDDCEVPPAVTMAEIGR